MATTPPRRNSHNGLTPIVNPVECRRSTKSSAVRRTQSVRYTNRHNSNSNYNNVTSNVSSASLRSRRVASIPSSMVNLSSCKVSSNDGDSSPNKSPTKAKNDVNFFNFVIAKDLDHFKNEKVFRVLVAGYPDCGKTTLISQFSHYLEEQRQMKPVSNIADPSHYLILNFKEIVSFENCLPKSPITVYQPDAYIVVYSVNDRDSFEAAKQLIAAIHKWDDVESKPLILVANKTDLVRGRLISKQEGRQIATASNCKYIETSCAISHNIDFLLAGIGAQIQLKNNNNGKITQLPGRKSNIFKRFLRKAVLNKSKSCDNLHVL